MSFGSLTKSGAIMAKFVAQAFQPDGRIGFIEIDPKFIELVAPISRAVGEENNIPKLIDQESEPSLLILRPRVGEIESRIVFLCDTLESFREKHDSNIPRKVISSAPLQPSDIALTVRAQLLDQNPRILNFKAASKVARRRQLPVSTTPNVRYLQAAQPGKSGTDIEAQSKPSPYYIEMQKLKCDTQNVYAGQYAMIRHEPQTRDQFRQLIMEGKIEFQAEMKRRLEEIKEKLKSNGQKDVEAFLGQYDAWRAITDRTSMAGAESYPSKARYKDFGVEANAKARLASAGITSVQQTLREIVRDHIEAAMQPVDQRKPANGSPSI